MEFDNHKTVAPFCTNHHSIPCGTSDRARCAFCDSREFARNGNESSLIQHRHSRRVQVNLVSHSDGLHQCLEELQPLGADKAHQNCSIELRRPRLHSNRV